MGNDNTCNAYTPKDETRKEDNKVEQQHAQSPQTSKPGQGQQQAHSPQTGKPDQGQQGGQFDKRPSREQSEKQQR